MGGALITSAQLMLMLLNVAQQDVGALPARAQLMLMMLNGMRGIARESPADAHDAGLDVTVFAQESPADAHVAQQDVVGLPARAQLMLMMLA